MQCILSKSKGRDRKIFLLASFAGSFGVAPKPPKPLDRYANKLIYKNESSE